MKEDWLKSSDYFSAFKVSLILFKKVKKIPLWNGLNVSEIIKEELYKDIGSPSLMNAVLIHKFIKRLKEKKVDVDIVIDWNENQVIDRAVNLAFNKYYSNVYVKGYQGYIVPDFYACKDPTCFEIEAGTTPNEICVVGEAFIESKKKYCSSIKVSVAPAYRFSNSHNSKYLLCDKVSDILIILPISLEDSREILKICERLSGLIGEEFNFIVKYHPSFTKERFSSLVPEVLNSCFIFSEQKLYDHLCKSSLLISALSSVCLEAAVLGVPVAIIGSRSGPAMNPLHGLEGINSWQVCYNETEIIELLKSKIAPEVINIDYFFQPNTVKFNREFISIPHNNYKECNVV